MGPPITVDWASPSFESETPGQWTVRTCTQDPPSVCAERQDGQAGSIALQDVPSLGEEKTTSRDQVQAVLAGRINSLYQFEMGRWSSACGAGYRVTSERPQVFKIGAHDGMKYELTGSTGDRVVERLVGYWTFRDGIETLIEAPARDSGRCAAEPLGRIEPPPGVPLFSPGILDEFEPLLDRMVAGSRLPPPTEFKEEAGNRG